MATITKTKKADSTKKTKETPAKKGSDLSKIIGWLEGKISYDESIFNLGKRSAIV